MNDLRTAAQAVLDACTDAVAGWESLAPLAVRSAALESLDGLRAALAQQAEPVSADDAYRKWLEDTHAPALRRMDSQGAFAAGWKAALAQQAEPAQEPVAWAFRHSDGTYHDPSVTEHSAGMVPLYPPPPRQKPLTQEEIPALAEKAWKPSVYYDAAALLGADGLVALVRAVEAKHGIKE